MRLSEHLTALGAVVLAMSVWLVKTRLSPSRHSRDARVHPLPLTPLLRPPPRPFHILRFFAARACCYCYVFVYACAFTREHAMEGHMTAPLLNALYRPPRQGVSGGRGPSVRTVDVLRPCCELQGLEIWQSVFMRDNLLLHHRCVRRRILVCTWYMFCGPVLCLVWSGSFLRSLGGACHEGEHTMMGVCYSFKG